MREATNMLPLAQAPGCRQHASFCAWFDGKQVSDLLKLGNVGLCCLQDEVRPALMGAGHGGCMLRLILQAHCCRTQARQSQDF